MHAQDEVVAFYYRLPSSVPEPSCGEIGLPDYRQAARFESGAHFRGLHKKTRLLVACPGQRERRSPAGSSRDLVARKAPTGFEDPRNLASQSFLVCDVHSDGI